MTTTTTTTSTSRPSNADVPEPSYAPSAPPDGMGTWHAWARGTHSVCVCCARDESRRWCHRRCGANGGVVPMAVWCQWRCGANGGVVPMAVWCQWRCGANGGVVPTRDADGVWQHVEATTMWRRPAEAAGWHGAAYLVGARARVRAGMRRVACAQQAGGAVRCGAQQQRRLWCVRQRRWCVQQVLSSVQ